MAHQPAQFTVQDAHGLYQFPGELGRALAALVSDPATAAALYGNNGSLLAQYGPQGYRGTQGLPVLLKHGEEGEEYAVTVSPAGYVDGAPLGAAPLVDYLKFGWVLV